MMLSRAAPGIRRNISRDSPTIRTYTYLSITIYYYRLCTKRIIGHARSCTIDSPRTCTYYVRNSYSFFFFFFTRKQRLGEANVNVTDELASAGKIKQKCRKLVPSSRRFWLVGNLGSNLNSLHGQVILPYHYYQVVNFNLRSEECSSLQEE